VFHLDFPMLTDQEGTPSCNIWDGIVSKRNENSIISTILRRHRAVKSYPQDLDLGFLNRFTSFLLPARMEATSHVLHENDHMIADWRSTEEVCTPDQDRDVHTVLRTSSR
jgi:hypothetical protein